MKYDILGEEWVAALPKDREPSEKEKGEEEIGGGAVPVIHREQPENSKGGERTEQGAGVMEQLTPVLPTTVGVEFVEPTPEEDLTAKKVDVPRADIHSASQLANSFGECGSFEGG